MSNSQSVAIGSRIRAAREGKGLSVTELAERLGVEESKLREVEAGDCLRMTSIDAVSAVQRELVIDSRWLMGSAEAGAPCPVNDAELQERAARVLAGVERLEEVCAEITRKVKSLRCGTCYSDDLREAFALSELVLNLDGGAAAETVEAADTLAEYFRDKAEEERLPETAARMRLEVVTA